MSEKVVNAAIVEEVVTPQVQETPIVEPKVVSEKAVPEVASGTEKTKVETPAKTEQVSEKPKQSEQDNAAAAAARRRATEETQKKMFQEMKEYFQWPDEIDSYDKLKETMENTRLEEEAAEKNIDPAELKRQKERDARLAEYEKTESDRKQFVNFLEDFPGTTTDQIPAEVWKQFREGKNLSDAYRAYDYNVLKQKFATIEEERAAEAQNRTNAAANLGSMTSQAPTSEGMITQAEWDRNKENREWVTKNLSKVLKSRDAGLIQ